MFDKLNKNDSSENPLRPSAPLRCAVPRPSRPPRLTTSTNADPELQQGLKDRYRIERELGRGGMARVYLAYDLKHQRRVALKHLAPEVAAAMGTERFEREIRLAAGLQHPHICSVYDSGEVDGLLWFTMPFVEGESLEARLAREGPLPVPEALRITREAAQALAYAHEHDVIHRDIKPANLLLARDGSVLVADFGIARAIGHDSTGSNPSLTRTGFSPGTPAYMSPEQRAAAKEIDGRSDVYSLALVLYEMLTGVRPFADGPSGLMAQFQADSLPSIRARRDDAPAELDRVLHTALKADPTARYQSMNEFRAAVEGLISGVQLGQRGRAARRSWMVWAGVALIVALLGYGIIRRGTGSGPTSGNAISSAAVLPFLDQSPGQDQAYFSDGLTDELTTVLARVSGLKVIARSSAFQFRGSALDPREIGRRLGVGAVLQGSVRRSGERLRVSAQLVNTADGYEMWSESYDRSVADVFQVQEEIARAIGTALQVRLAAPADSVLRSRPTRDLAAYDAYLRGRFAVNLRTEQSLTEAARYFEEAVRRDSGFARAWAGLADTYLLQPLFGPTSPAVTWPKAKAAALRGIALDSTEAEAFTALAYGTMLNEWDWGGAERAFARAIAAGPSYPTAYQWYADFLAGRGRLEEALVQMGRARDLDPLSRIIGSEYAWLLNCLHRYDAADSAIAAVLRLDPSYSHGLFVQSMIRIEQKRYPEAIETLKRSIGIGGFSAHSGAALVAAYARAGDFANAQAQVDELLGRSRREYLSPFSFVVAYANIGDLNRAYQYLEQGIQERDVLLPENFFEPLLDPLKRDPRYAGYAARIRGP